MRLAALLFVVLAACSVSGPERDPSARWRPVTELEGRLPAAVRVLSLEDPTWPLRAWCVRADLADPSVSGRVVVSRDSDRRQTASAFAEQLDACVVVNAGFFARRKEVATHQGILCVDGELLQGTRDRNPALGFDARGRADIAWTTVRGGRVLELPHGRLAAGASVRPPRGTRTVAEEWAMRDVVQAKPPLLFDGVAYELDDSERHPRTAAGITAAGELVLLVVDGRQAESRGATLAELATLMAELGCVEALNLDGGGSSTLVVAGQRLNRPQGRDVEREVMSAVVLVAER